MFAGNTCERPLTQRLCLADECFNVRRKIAQYGEFKDTPQRNLAAKNLAQTQQQLGHQERMSSQLKKIAIAPDFSRSEQA